MLFSNDRSLEWVNEELCTPQVEYRAKAFEWLVTLTLSIVLAFKNQESIHYEFTSSCTLKVITAVVVRLIINLEMDISECLWKWRLCDYKSLEIKQKMSK